MGGVDFEKELSQRGSRRERLTKQLDEVNAELKPLIIAAAEAGVPQVDIAQWTRYTRESIRKICLTPEQAETEEKARRDRRKKT